MLEPMNIAIVALLFIILVAVVTGLNKKPPTNS